MKFILHPWLYFKTTLCMYSVALWKKYVCKHLCFMWSTNTGNFIPSACLIYIFLDFLRVELPNYPCCCHSTYNSSQSPTVAALRTAKMWCICCNDLPLLGHLRQNLQVISSPSAVVYFVTALFRPCPTKSTLNLPAHASGDLWNHAYAAWWSLHIMALPNSSPPLSLTKMENTTDWCRHRTRWSNPIFDHRNFCSLLYQVKWCGVVTITAASGLFALPTVVTLAVSSSLCRCQSQSSAQWTMILHPQRLQH